MRWNMRSRPSRTLAFLPSPTSTSSVALPPRVSPSTARGVGAVGLGVELGKRRVRPQRRCCHQVRLGLARQTLGGLMVAGVPVGTAAFVEQCASARADDILSTAPRRCRCCCSRSWCSCASGTRGALAADAAVAAGRRGHAPCGDHAVQHSGWHAAPPRRRPAGRWRRGVGASRGPAAAWWHGHPLRRQSRSRRGVPGRHSCRRPWPPAQRFPGRSVS
jgi:hypothetical protein